MKIEYRKGDLFSTEIKYIGHGCNCQGIMGSGVAKIVKEKYPEAFNVYKNRWNTSGLSLGDVIWVDTNGKTILNIMTQQNYGRTSNRFTSYDAIADAMEKINDYFYTVQGGELALPMIGAGLGNGSWEVISAIIETELTAVKPVVYML